MIEFMIIGGLILAGVLFMAFRPRKKNEATKENGWENPNFQKRKKGISSANSPAETSGYLGGGVD